MSIGGFRSNNDRILDAATLDFAASVANEVARPRLKAVKITAAKTLIVARNVRVKAFLVCIKQFKNTAYTD